MSDKAHKASPSRRWGRGIEKTKRRSKDLHEEVGSRLCHGEEPIVTISCPLHVRVPAAAAAAAAAAAYLRPSTPVCQRIFAVGVAALLVLKPRQQRRKASSPLFAGEEVGVDGEGADDRRRRLLFLALLALLLQLAAASSEGGEDAAGVALYDAGVHVVEGQVAVAKAALLRWEEAKLVRGDKQETVESQGRVLPSD
eukprot:756283-Hanusia_phi.AAC.4